MKKCILLVLCGLSFFTISAQVLDSMQINSITPVSPTEVKVNVSYFGLNLAGTWVAVNYGVGGQFDKYSSPVKISNSNGNFEVNIYGLLPNSAYGCKPYALCLEKFWATKNFTTSAITPLDPCAGFGPVTFSPVLNATPGTHSYSTTVTDSLGCEANGTIVVTVPDCPVTPPVGGGQDTTKFVVCQGSYLTISAPQGVAYKWSNGETYQTIPIVTNLNPAVKNLNCIVTLPGGLKDTAYFTVYVYPNPNPIKVATAGGNVFCDVTEIGTDLDDQFSQFTYQWYKNGSPIFGAKNPTLVVTMSGLYKVRVTHPCGTFYSDQVDITINDCISGGGEPETEDFGSEISPNPTTGIYTAKVFGFSGDISFNLYDNLGQIIIHVVRDSPGQVTEQFDISQLPAGVYTLQIIAGDQVVSRQIVKSN